MSDKINITPSRQKLIIYIILTVITLAVYMQVRHYDFINFDDNFLVFENHNIQSGITLKALRWAFTTNQADLWNPFLWFSLLLDNQFYGLNAGGYHVTNLIMHILSALMLFWLFNRMTQNVWPSAFVAAAFALHPLHVESVAWIAERKDTLSAFFWMLTLCLYVYYTEKRDTKRYLLCLFSFFCALMSKAMVVTLPLIIILLDYWPLKRFDSQKDKSNLISWQLKEKAPFFILSAVFSVITLYIQYYIPSLQNHYSRNMISLDDRLANAAVSFVTYLGKMLWPHDMAVFYPFPAHIPAWQIIGATLLIILISAVVIVMAKRLPYLIVGWLWYTITILPVIKIVQIGDDAMADRYTYLPSIGIFIMLAWGIFLLLKNEAMRKKILLPVAIAIIILFSVLTWKQCGYWKNTATIFNHTLRVTENNFLAHSIIAAVLVDEGKIDEAIEHCNNAIRIEPNFSDAYKVRGNAYNMANQLQQALENYNELIRLKPNDQDAYNGKGVVYAKVGRYQQAIEEFNIAIRLKQDYVNAYNNRSQAYLLMGNNELGCGDAQKACELGDCRMIDAVRAKGICR